MAKYSKAAEKKIAKVMREKKRGTLKSSSGKKVTSRKQAIAIGISEARQSGMKVPGKAAKKTGRKPAKRSRTMARRKTARKRSS